MKKILLLTAFIAGAFLVQAQSNNPAEPSNNENGSVTNRNAASLTMAIPGSLKSFSATRNQQTVYLKWETATENNNRGFYVQRRIGSEWKNVALIFSQADGGNSASELTYQYKEKNSDKGMSQYRILVVNMQGYARSSDSCTVSGNK